MLKRTEREKEFVVPKLPPKRREGLKLMPRNTSNTELYAGSNELTNPRTVRPYAAGTWVHHGPRESDGDTDDWT